MPEPKDSDDCTEGDAIALRDGLSEVGGRDQTDSHGDDEDLRVHWMDEALIVGPPIGAWHADRRRAIIAWALAILLHALLLLALIASRNRFLGLHMALTRGTTAVAGEAGAADANAQTGPLLPASPSGFEEGARRLPCLRQPASRPKTVRRNLPPRRFPRPCRLSRS